MKVLSLEYKGTNSANMICNYLSGLINGIKGTGKETAIRNLLKLGHKVVTIEDSDFSHIVHPNHLFIRTYGFISNNHAFKVKNFIEGLTNNKG